MTRRYASVEAIMAHHAGQARTGDVRAVADLMELCATCPRKARMVAAAFRHAASPAIIDTTAEEKTG